MAGKGKHSVNGRDGAGKRLGIKIFGGQKIKAGGIILRQRGTKIFPGLNVGMGKDHTLFAKTDGIIKFEFTSGARHRVSIYTA